MYLDLFFDKQTEVWNVHLYMVVALSLKLFRTLYHENRGIEQEANLKFMDSLPYFGFVYEEHDVTERIQCEEDGDFDRTGRRQAPSGDGIAFTHKNYHQEKDQGTQGCNTTS